jgi:1-phosphatidylinositol-3-phosphate 5-kinase
MAQALDKIHTSASQSDVLTTFNDFAPPPASAPIEGKGSPGELVHQGISGLYSRFKEAVGVGGKTALQEPEVTERNEGSSKKAKTSLGSLKSAEGSASQFSDFPPSATPSHAPGPAEAVSQPPQSSKASSIATVSTAKSAPSLPKIVKGAAPSVAPTAVAPITVSAFKDSDATRGVTNRVEENSRRPNQMPELKTTSASRGSSIYDPSDARNFSHGDLITNPRGARRDGSFSLDAASDDASLSHIKSNSTAGGLEIPHPRQPRDSLKKPAVIDRISRSRTSAGGHSRSSSIEGTAEPSPINMSAHGSVYHESFGHNERPEQFHGGGIKIPGTTAIEGPPGGVSNRLEMMRKQVLSKEFWMADETTKECFQCGAPFSAFRRKHHCRTCGCIFDSKCTSTIPGQRFGVAGNLRVCKTCLDVINSRYDSGSDSDNDSYLLPAIFRSNPLKPAPFAKANMDDNMSISERTEDHDDNRMAIAPMMAIPAMRRTGGDSANRRSAILEIDAAPQLSRPSSSRSLRSLATSRPQSSGHRRHHSKHNLLNRLKGSPVQDDSAPFRKSANEELQRKPKLPAFHDDNIIDPELAPYMSDESSGDEQQMSIFATMNSSDITPSSLDPDKSNFGPFLNAGRRHKIRGEKSISGLSFTSRGPPDDGNAGVTVINHGRPGRRRNMSTTSNTAHHLRSPRPRSGIFRGPGASTESLAIFDPATPIEPTSLMRSNTIRKKSTQDDDLPAASLQHVQTLFGQLLQDNGIQNPLAWEKALVPILVRCSNDVDPDTRVGDLMDIRHYVKLKKIPGGKPGDTSYVSGVIFTKNLALKSMPRRILNPRIVLVSFPIEYQRHQQQHFMSLQPVIEQEKEFLRMVVNRIINLRPHVLLAHKSVSGVALQYLSEAGIAVAYNVKLAVIEAVSRCAKADIIETLDMLVLPTQVGQAGGFEVKTYVNNSFPGRKKTYIFISGCKKELGCTIALRGASTEVLDKMKSVTEFMTYVVYNLKLEAALLRDHFVYMGTDPDTAPTPSKDGLGQSLRSLPSFENKSVLGALSTNGDQPADSEQNTQSQADSDPKTEESQPPDPMPPQPPEKTPSMLSLHSAHSTHDSHIPEDVPAPQFYSEMVAKYETKILSASPFVKFTQPYLLVKAREQERRLVYLKRLRDQDMIEELGENENAKPQKFQLIKPEMVHKIGQKAPRQIMEVLHAVHDAEYDKALYNYRTQTRQWENFIAGALDLFDPYSHQNIVVLYSVICTETKIPCSEPGLIAFGFYHDDPADNMDPDCTLGQYIEDLCGSADSICHANGCDRQMAQHHRTYVHDEAHITVFIEKNAPLPFDPTLLKKDEVVPQDGEDPDDPIYLWSYCKICKRDMGFGSLSPTARKYSFGKYLELSFWGRGLKCWPDLECPHDYQKEHIRYFNYHDTSMRVHFDPIDLLEIIVPRTRLTWKVDNDLRLKNDIFTKEEQRWNRFMNSVKTRLKSIRIDSVLPEKADACKAEIERLTKKASEDQPRMIRELQATYINSAYYEVIPLNRVVRTMIERVAEWDSAFAKFEADFLSDKDVRQITINQLKKMFSDNDSKESLPVSADGTSIASADTDEKTSPPTTQGSVIEINEKAQSEPHLPATSPKPDELLNKDEGVREGNIAVSDNTEIPKPEVHGPGPASSSDPVATKDEEPARDHAAEQNGISDAGDHDSKQEPAVEESRVPQVEVDETKADSPPSTEAMDIPETLPVTQIPTPVHSKAPSRNHSRSTSLRPDSSLSLTEKVEQLRRQQREAAAAEPNSGREGKDIPKAPEKGSSRRAGMTVSPPITRAISQPIGVLPRTQAGIGRPLQANVPKSAELPAGGDSRRISTAESTKSDKSKLSDRFGLAALKTKKAGGSSIPRYVHKRKETKVSNLARHFEQLSREFEKERIRDRKQRAAKLQSSRAFLPRTSAKAIVEVYDDVDQAVLEPGPSDDDHLQGSQQSHTKMTEFNPDDPTTAPESERTSDETVGGNHTAGTTEPVSQPDSTSTEHDNEKKPASQAGSDDEAEGVAGSDVEGSLLEEILPDVQEIADSLDSSEEIPLELPKHQKTSLMKMLTTFWAERSASGWPQLDYPMNFTDHIFTDSDVIVREDEPSSLIAFALGSEDYKVKLAVIQRQWKMSEQKDSEGEAFSDTKSLDPSEPGDEFMGEEELEKSLLRATGTHLKYQFTEGSAKMLCKIFYAEQFDALRRKCGAADRIIESLSRCLKWDSKGGKTKSVFLKTLDDRLVMKSLSPIETSAFLRFAPAYFNIMAEALFHDLPSVIAKMLGFFQVIVKNPVTGTEIKLDLLVMENLFYDRSPTRIFDLKGSMRNRKIQSTGEQNEVLLDENMVEYIYESPLFAREHSKKLLRASVSFVPASQSCAEYQARRGS